MGNSLQEQLLKTGLVDKSKLNQAKQQKSKQNEHQQNICRSFGVF